MALVTAHYQQAITQGVSDHQETYQAVIPQPMRKRPQESANKHSIPILRTTARIVHLQPEWMQAIKLGIIHSFTHVTFTPCPLYMSSIG